MAQDRAHVVDPPGEGVVGVLVDHRVLAASGHDRGQEAGDQGRAVVELEEEAPTRPQTPVDALEDAAVLVVVEVAEGGEPVHDDVELFCPREGADVAVDVVDGDSSVAGVGPGDLEEPLGNVEAGHRCAPGRQPVG